MMHLIMEVSLQEAVTREHQDHSTEASEIIDTSKLMFNWAPITIHLMQINHKMEGKTC